MSSGFDASKVECVGFDVDGTLYSKDKEYIPRHGSIQDSHDFFRFSAYDRLKQGQTPEQVALELVAAYKEAMKEGNLKAFVDSIPPLLRTEFEEIVARNGGSNGKALMKEFGTSSTFLHEMLSHIDFDFILAADPKLRQLINILKARGYKLGILTTEIFDTVQKVFKALGLDIADFNMNIDSDIPFLTAENVTDKKPGAEGFEKLVKGFGSSPEKVLYVGDHIVKDVEASLRCGLQAVHVLNDKRKGVVPSTIQIEEKDVEYTAVGTIYDVGKVLRRPKLLLRS